MKTNEIISGALNKAVLPETKEKTKGFKGLLKDIFSQAVSKARSHTDGNEAQKQLNDNKKISFSPKSLRYTYADRSNFNLNSKWKPSDKNASPDDKLSPRDYFRPKTSKNINGKYDRSVVNPDRLEDFYRTNKEFFEKKDKMNRTNNERRNIAIDSTAIKNFSYDPKTEGLTVQFQGNSKKYFYPGVPVDLIRKWIDASSKGEFFLSNIHDQYSMNPSHRHSTNVKNKDFYKWFKKNYKRGKK